jgi:glycosyltransferase involved in cell wall biosynthesis
MVTHSFYESDNRVLRYAESLAQRGDHVDVVALRRASDLAREETIGGVNLFRIQDRFGKDNHAKPGSFLWPLLRFLASSSWWLTRRHWRQRYDLIHVHNIPDFLVFAAWYPKLTGAKVILDIHDIVPEFFASKFRVSEGSGLVRGLRFAEKISAAFAHHVILANHLWLDKYVARSANRQKCSVFINHVDSEVFHPVQRGSANGKQVILFPGGLQWHQGVDIAIRAFDQLRRRLPEVEFHIYGEGNMKPNLVSLAGELGLNGSVRFLKPLPIREIAHVMAQADLGVVPKRADSFGNEAYSTKIMEFMSVGVPVVVSNTRIDRYYFNDSVVRFFESGKPDALAEAMLEVLSNRDLRDNLVGRASEYAARNNWNSRRGDYLRLVDALADRRHSGGTVEPIQRAARSVPPSRNWTNPAASARNWRDILTNQPRPNASVGSMHDTSYCLLTACRNESRFIGDTIQSVLGQSLRPKVWLILDDGSTDGTGEVVKRMSAGREWIQLQQLAARNQRSFGAQYRAIMRGYESIRNLTFSFVGVLDGDITLESPQYYEGLMNEFSRRLRLGLAGGTICEQQRGVFRERPGNAAWSVAGAVQMFRREVFESVGGYTPLEYGGSDGLAVLLAQMAGWEVRSFAHLRALHHRPTSSVGGLLWGTFNRGRMEAAFGYHPVFALFKYVRRLKFKPAVLGSLLSVAGFLTYKIQGGRPVIPAAALAFLRQGQLERLSRTLRLRPSLGGEPSK